MRNYADAATIAWPGHLYGIDRVSLFRSPRVRANRGRCILPGFEEIEFLIDGRAFFDHAGRDIEIGCGAILWHQTGEMTVHRTDPADPYVCVVVAFAVSGQADPRPPRLSLSTDPAESRAFALDLHDSYHRGGLDRGLLAMQAYLALRWRAHRSERAMSDPRLPAPVAAACRMLDRRFAEPVTIEDIAAVAGLRPSQLHRLFRLHVGRTPWEALADRRIAAARRLLSSGEESVHQVGVAVGWPDHAHFTRIFRSRVGLTPSAYRQRYRVG
jgi:AraC-like DNA-binding protein